MKYDEVPAGRYQAFATRARAQKSKAKGTPYIEVEFRIPECEDVHVRWQGYLTEKTINRTMETMVLLDWNNDENFGPGSINTERPVSLTITKEIGSDGKERSRVQWVNDGARSKFEGLAPTEFAGLNLKGAMAAARQRAGVQHREPSKGVPPAFGPEPGFDNGEDIPW